MFTRDFDLEDGLLKDILEVLSVPLVCIALALLPITILFFFLCVEIANKSHSN
jgi:hypothetical protein